MSKKVYFFYCIFDKIVVNYTAYGGQLYMSQKVYILGQYLRRAKAEIP